MGRSTAEGPRQAARPKGTTGRSRQAARAAADAADRAPLTTEQVREIERRLKDLDDPTRYFLVSDFGAGFKLYYEISDGVYVMNELTKATLFKTREAALAVRSTLGPGIKLVRCRTTVTRGRRVPVVEPRHHGLKKTGESRSRRTRG